MMIYAVVAATAFAGMFDASWWCAVIGASLLMLALVSDTTRQTPISGTSLAIGEAVQLLTATITGAAFGTAAFFAGRATSWLWGV